jgi:hypothetical protein
VTRKKPRPERSLPASEPEVNAPNAAPPAQSVDSSQ